MRSSKLLIILLIITITISFNSETLATKVSFRIFSSGMRIYQDVESVNELRFKNVVKQKYDMSCGSAALATVFQYNYNDDISEEEIIDMIMKLKNINSLQNKEGFSLLDLKMAAEFFDYTAYGLKGSVESLQQLHLPMIVLLNSPRGPHFVVVRKIDDEFVQVADPALGNQTLKVSEFKSQWNNILLAIENKNKVLKNNFNINTAQNISYDNLNRLIDFNWLGLPINYYEF